MKKLSLFLTLFVFTLITNAQSFSFGAKTGLNIATISGDHTDGYEAKVGMIIGAVAEFKISDTFAFQPELLYSIQGANTKNSNLKLKMNYLNLPIMAKYYPTENLSLQLGPQVGFLLAAKLDNGEQTTKVDDNIKTIDLGLSFGLGYKLDFGLFFETRYNLGLANINDFQTTDKNHNAVLNFSVGYYFN